jgi:hypothetical protein
VLATLSCERTVHEGGLNEKRLLNHDRFGEDVLPDADEDETAEKLEMADAGPERSEEYGTGSIVTFLRFFNMPNAS